jgi:AAA domain
VENDPVTPCDHADCDQLARYEWGDPPKLFYCAWHHGIAVEALNRERDLAEADALQAEVEYDDDGNPVDAPESWDAFVRACHESQDDLVCPDCGEKHDHWIEYCCPDCGAVAPRLHERYEIQHYDGCPALADRRFEDFVGSLGDVKQVTLVSTQLSKRRAERVTWYLDGMIPKALPTTLAAPGGTVKGLHVLFVVHHYIPGNVLYFGTEDDFEQIIIPRSLALGMDVDRFVPITKRVGSGGEQSLRFPSDRALLEKALQLHDARAVIIDSGVEHLDEGLQANKSEDVRQFTNMINLVARERRICPLVILHTNKDKEASGVNRVGHAKTWTDASRHVLMAAMDDEDPNVRHVEVSKTNIGTKGYGRAYRIEQKLVTVWDPDEEREVGSLQPYLVDIGESSKSVDDLLGTRKRTEADLEIDPALLAYLADLDEPVPSKHVDSMIASECGCSERTVRDHRIALGRRKLVQATPECDEKGLRTGWLVAITPDGLRELYDPDPESFS